MKVNKGIKVPHTMVIIFSIIILVTILTYVVPAGEYDRVIDPNTERTVIDVNSYHQVEQNPVGPFKMFTSIPVGMVDASAISFFVIILGGSFELISATGAIDAGIRKVLKTIKNDVILIPILMIMFSILGFTIGASEELIAFIPLSILLVRGFGYDDVTGVAIVSLGAASGFSGAMFNPFTTGIAHGIAGLPIYSGAGFRTIGYVFFLAIAIVFVVRYAKKVQKDPTNSVIYGVDRETTIEDVDMTSDEFTNRHKLVLVGFVIGLIIMVYGVVQHAWFLNEISALFIIMALVLSFVGGIKINDMPKAFVTGAKGVVFAAVLIGLSRTILIVLQEGRIIDSIINYLGSALQELPVQFTAVGMFWANAILNFFIPSGSGQISTVMPIMAPLADLVGITRQTAVLAVTYGDAFTNQIIPTGGTLLASLTLAGVPWDRWFKFVWRLMILWILAGSIMVAIAATIKLGPA